MPGDCSVNGLNTASEGILRANLHKAEEICWSILCGSTGVKKCSAGNIVFFMRSSPGAWLWGGFSRVSQIKRTMFLLAVKTGDSASTLGGMVSSTSTIEKQFLGWQPLSSLGKCNNLLTFIRLVMFIVTVNTALRAWGPFREEETIMGVLDVDKLSKGLIVFQFSSAANNPINPVSCYPN